MKIWEIFGERGREKAALVRCTNSEIKVMEGPTGKAIPPPSRANTVEDWYVYLVSQDSDQCLPSTY